MQFYRLIKPEWAKQYIKDEPNPDFIREINGPNVIEGCLSEEDIRQLNKIGYNAYWFPNKPSRDVYKEDNVRHLSGRHIDVFDYIFVDMDLKDGDYANVEEFLKIISEFPVKPTITVKSGNGCHVYWKISNLNRELYVLSQFALLRHFKTDKSVWTVLQLMRVPGSLNTKKADNFKTAEIVEELSTGQEYEISEFPKEIFMISDEDKNKAENHIAKLDGKLEIRLPENVNIDELPDHFIEFVTNPDNVAVYNLFTNPTELYSDRSAADMRLANILFNQRKKIQNTDVIGLGVGQTVDGGPMFSKDDAMQIISNTQKALEKGPHRFEYAQITVDKAFVDRTKNKFMTVGQRIKSGDKKISGEPVHGPYFLDRAVLHNPWRKKQVMGLIGGTGVGKTEVTLKIFRDMIANNTENDDVFVFISLEMPEMDIVERWVKAVGENSPLAERLYVIANEDENGEPRNIGLQEIHEYCEDIKRATGKNIASIAVDHIGIVSKHIDTRKKYTFGIQNEENGGWAEVRTLSLNNIATQMKSLAKMLDTFLIVLTQTTKEKGVGDLPIDKDGAYGISQYENIMDYIVTIWQPLMRVHHLTDLRFLAWQYVKIRNKHKLDKIQTHEQKLLTYEAMTGDLRPPSEDEYAQFRVLLPQAHAAREQRQKQEAGAYSRTLNMNEINAIASKLHDLKIM